MTVKAVLNSFSSRADMMEAVEDYFREEIQGLKEIREKSVTLGLDLEGGIEVTTTANFNALPEEKRPTNAEERSTAINNALEILNSRIDRFGISEPQIRKQGEEQIIISLPGLADPERIKSIILGKGMLGFYIVDKEGLKKFNDYHEQNPGNFLKESDKLELRDPGILPPGTILREVVEKDKFGIDQRVDYTVLKEEVGLDGIYITDANVTTDERTLETVVVFRLDNEGAGIFDKLTNENQKEIMAVVLDEKVRFTAEISERISGGSVRVSGAGFDAQEASDLARVLKTGALPVPLEISAQEAVGATLGAEAVRVGLSAIIMGLILVISFMLVYYRGGGVISNIALILNFYFMAAILSVFNFTLTLPSIASFILTVGMAVDANVIVFERIKEEYRLGKSRKASIKAGFSKAFWTIMDANITTGIAALVLAYFGKGTIKGFAVVLATGIICSMFTALFVSRLLFDFVTDVFKANKLSLDWKTGGTQNE
jgi:preprotein translocase subunit SecD